MNDSHDGDRDAPGTDGSDEDPSEAEPSSSRDRTPGLEDPLLDAALEPVSNSLAELISVDSTPPEHARTESDRTPRPKRSADRRSSRDDAGGKSLFGDVPSDDYHVEARRTNDEIVVTAELPAVAADELFVGLDEDEQSLVVAVNGAVVAREFYDWEAIDVSAVRFDAPDLEVRLEPAADSTPE